MKWFESHDLAEEAKNKLDPSSNKGIDVFKWTHTKRKKPFFVGTEFEWLNI